ALRAMVAAIPADAWTPIGSWLGGGADVAGTSYWPFGPNGRVTRLIVRRVRPTPGSQPALFCGYGYHPFTTDRQGSTVDLEADPLGPQAPPAPATRWPWARRFGLALDRLRCVPFPT